PIYYRARGGFIHFFLLWAGFQVAWVRAADRLHPVPHPMRESGLPQTVPGPTARRRNEVQHGRVMGKKAMLELDDPGSTDDVRHRPVTASCESLRVAVAASGARLPRLVDHRLAILVNQGSDPTVPYQALVIRESAKLFLGFAPWGRKA